MSQSKTYDYIERYPGCTVDEIADYYGSTYATYYVYATKLWKKGLIERRRVDSPITGRWHYTYYVIK